MCSGINTAIVQFYISSIVKLSHKYASRSIHWPALFRNPPPFPYLHNPVAYTLPSILGPVAPTNTKHTRKRCYHSPLYGSPRAAPEPCPGLTPSRVLYQAEQRAPHPGSSTGEPTPRFPSGVTHHNISPLTDRGGMRSQAMQRHVGAEIQPAADPP